MAVIMHVDMDCFYASVELARRPDLRGMPMFVGGAHRGIVLSATYEARAFGVRSGMPATTARRLCPQVVVIPPDYDSYAEVSRGVFAIFDAFTDRVEAASIDEAFLDITGAGRLWGSPRQIGEQVRSMVADEQRIACSVGIGSSKFVAKLASGQAKPDGLLSVADEDVVGFLHRLPVEALWGVGESTAGQLHRLGIRTVAELAHVRLDTLRRAFGARQGQLLADLAWGRDARRVVPTVHERSIGSSQTFGTDIDDPARIRVELLRMAERTTSRMRMAHLVGRTVVLWVRFSDFTDLTRSVTLDSPTDVTGDVHAAAVRLFERLGLQRARIRKVGVRVEGLVDADRAVTQPTLDEPDHGWRDAERAVDAVVARFGPTAVNRAALTRGRGPSQGRLDPEESQPRHRAPWTPSPAPRARGAFWTPPAS